MPQGYKNGIKMIPPSQKGVKRSPITLEKMRKAVLGIKRDPKIFNVEWRRKMSKALKGKSTRGSGWKHSEETKRKLSLKNKGKKVSAETRKKLSLALKGRKILEESRKKMSISRMGHFTSKETRIKISLANKGKPKSEEHRKHLSGENCHLWRGGITPETRRLRSSLEYKIWRKAVFERDAYTCQVCKKVGGELNSHHIKSWSEYKELRFDVNNGITLCEDCHRLTDNFANNKKKQC